MGVSPTGGRNGGGVITGGGDLCITPPEHSCTVNYEQAHYGPVSGSREAYRVMGDQVVVRTGRIDLEGMQTATWQAE